MTAQPTAPTMSSSRRFPRWAAITSGVIGIMGFGLLEAALLFRGSSPRMGELLFKVHDAALISQSVFMFPVAFGLHRLARPQNPGVSRPALSFGLVALSLVVLLLSLSFSNVVADDVYMVPQGFVGLWLIVVNRLVSSALPRGLTRLGTVAGLGLILVGTFPLLFAIFVDPVVLGFRLTPAGYPPSTGTDRANDIIHIVLLTGTLTGVAMYPIWTFLLGYPCRVTRQLDWSSYNRTGYPT